jgi:hypothetical protein
MCLQVWHGALPGHCHTGHPGQGARGRAAALPRGVCIGCVEPSVILDHSSLRDIRLRMSVCLWICISVSAQLHSQLSQGSVCLHEAVLGLGCQAALDPPRPPVCIPPSIFPVMVILLYLSLSEEALCDSPHASTTYVYHSMVCLCDVFSTPWSAFVTCTPLHGLPL